MLLLISAFQFPLSFLVRPTLVTFLLLLHFLLLPEFLNLAFATPVTSVTPLARHPIPYVNPRLPIHPVNPVTRICCSCCHVFLTIPAELNLSLVKP